MAVQTGFRASEARGRNRWASAVLTLLAVIAVGLAEYVQGRDANPISLGRFMVYDVGGLVPVVLAGLLVGMALWDVRRPDVRWSRLAIAALLLLPIVRYVIWAISILDGQPIAILSAPDRFYGAGALNVFACLVGVSLASAFRDGGSLATSSS